jgi:hypothetical protein
LLDKGPSDAVEGRDAHFVRLGEKDWEKSIYVLLLKRRRHNLLLPAVIVACIPSSKVN